MGPVSYPDRYINMKEALTKQEREAGDYILTHIAGIDQLSIQELAKQAKVSSATITRLTKRLNYTNFSELKSYIREEQKNEADRQSGFSSPVASYYDKMLTSVASLVHQGVIDELASYVKQAKKIILLGVGSSGLTAMEGKMHLSRMGLPVDCLSDPHMMKMSASLLSKNDLIICFSNSGDTQAIIEAVRIAQKNQVTVVSLTTSNHSQLANVSDLTLATASIATIDDPRFINRPISECFSVRLFIL